MKRLIIIGIICVAGFIGLFYYDASRPKSIGYMFPKEEESPVEHFRKAIAEQQEKIAELERMPEPVFPEHIKIGNAYFKLKSVESDNHRIYMIVSGGLLEGELRKALNGKRLYGWEGYNYDYIELYDGLPYERKQLASLQERLEEILTAEENAVDIL